MYPSELSLILLYWFNTFLKIYYYEVNKMEIA